MGVTTATASEALRTAMVTPSLLPALLKGRLPGGGTGIDERTTTRDETRDSDYARIRCPRCQWRPTASSRWFCVSGRSPEPPFDACGTAWNTFDTRGRCPGCSHQWVWTTCLRCAVASKHEEWYERDQG